MRNPNSGSSRRNSIQSCGRLEESRDRFRCRGRHPRCLRRGNPGLLRQEQRSNCSRRLMLPPGRRKCKHRLYQPGRRLGVRSPRPLPRLTGHADRLLRSEVRLQGKLGQSHRMTPILRGHGPVFYRCLGRRESPRLFGLYCGCRQPRVVVARRGSPRDPGRCDAGCVGALHGHRPDKVRDSSRRRFWFRQLMERPVQPVTVFLTVRRRAEFAVPQQSECADFFATKQTMHEVLSVLLKRL